MKTESVLKQDKEEKIETVTGRSDVNGIFPNLFIVGAAKSGTSSLHYYLSQHPEIFMSHIKEPHFFSTVKSNKEKTYSYEMNNEFLHTRVFRDLRTYLSLFQTEKKDYKYKGESSPSYLYDVQSPVNIFSFNPSARIIIILREPCKRAFSHYNMDYSLGKQRETVFKKAIEKDIMNPKKNWGEAHLYIELGFYFNQITRYYNVFPAHQIYILKFEDLITRPLDAINGIFQFLKLDTSPVNNFKLEVQNQTRLIKNKLFHYLLYDVKHSHLLQKLNKKIPSRLKKVLKEKIYTKSNNEKKIDHESLNFLEDIFHMEKVLLKKHFGIEWLNAEHFSRQPANDLADY